jgi:5-oxoprolinase (ATP-hydrolysing) subunit A
MLSATNPFLNIDAGEDDAEPDELYVLAHAVSIACGGHAGDDRSMARVLSACARAGTRAGAHPSYEDREGFGRREIAIEPAALARSVRAQCERLATIARACGVTLSHVKAHGALYHAANRDLRLARAVVEGARGALGSPLVLGPPDGELRRAAEEAALSFAREGFADRAMRADGSLVPRGEPGAVIADPGAARAQARRLAASGAFDTLCVHGDTTGAIAIARAVRAELDALDTSADG